VCIGSCFSASHSLGGKNKKISNAQKAGLIFSPSRVRSVLEEHLIDYKMDFRISSTAPVYLAAVLEYLITELLDLASGAIDSRKTIHVKDIKRAIEEDDEISRTLCRLKK
jgi:histone H2A